MNCQLMRSIAVLLCTVFVLESRAGAAATPNTGEIPAIWHAPLPHNGRLTDLTRWWEQFDDALLSELIAAGQEVSPTIASAKSRIEQSRAARVSAGATLLPTLDGTTSSVRTRPDLTMPLMNTSTAELQASWELDLFGANRAGRDSAQARLESAQADWHDARVSVAAEIANSYVAYRASEALAREQEIDAASRGETARLTELSQKGGLQSSSNAALARASAAQGRVNLSAQRADSERSVKALVALTGIDESTLRARLASNVGRVPKPTEIAVNSIPAEALAQRPDLFSAARNVVAASADVKQSQAQRYPRISLNGSIGAARLETGAGTQDGTVWSVGPVSVVLPIFDGGRRRADVDAARARYDEATAIYRAQLRSAVREVEETLVTLQSTAERAIDAQLAADNFQLSFLAAEARYNGGLGSLFDLEDARRTAVQSRIALIDLERERVSAWISLYRALGGGWQITNVATAAAQNSSQT